MKILTLIPARLNSSRFPRKPLKKIFKHSMILEVYKNVSKCKLLKDIFVATCDEEIFDHVTLNNGKAIMTSKLHQRASDRCAEALHKIERKKKIKYDVVLMVQGDEPLVNSKMIEQSLKPFKNNKKVNVVNLVGKIDKKEAINKDCIKVVKNKFNDALYFTRTLIPSGIQNGGFYLKQICIIPFRRDFLKRYINLKPTFLEKLESIDMLRILENGYNVKLVETKEVSIPVDRKEDILKVRKYLIKKLKK